MTNPTSEQKSCACHSDDAYDCWSSRYPSAQSAQEIEMDGGPCACVCHDRRDEDPAEYL